VVAGGAEPVNKSLRLSSGNWWSLFDWVLTGGSVQYRFTQQKTSYSGGIYVGSREDKLEDMNRAIELARKPVIGLSIDFESAREV
jgi:hypothetical protein